jgi:hypothetical protein
MFCKFRQTDQSLFIFMFEHLRGLNKFCSCGQSCRGLPYLSLDAKNTVIAPIILRDIAVTSRLFFDGENLDSFRSKQFLTVQMKELDLLT